MNIELKTVKSNIDEGIFADNMKNVPNIKISAG